MNMAYLFLPVIFFFNDTATTEIYTLSLHDALPISQRKWRRDEMKGSWSGLSAFLDEMRKRSEEHTSELQSQSNLVCRLLLEKKKEKTTDTFALSLKTATHTSSAN